MPPPIKRSRSRQPGRGGGSARQRPAPPPRRRLRSRSDRPGRPAPCAPLRCCCSPCSRSGPCPAAPPAPSSPCPSGPTRIRCPPAGRQVGAPCPTPLLPPLRAPPVLYKPLPHLPSRIPRRAPPPCHPHPRRASRACTPRSLAPRVPPRVPRLARTGTGTGTGSAAGGGAVPAGPGLRQGGARGPEMTGTAVGGGVSAGCAFGGHFYALEETWHPDLGEPFGVMRCVICHCEPVSAPTHPSPWETPRDPALLGRGLAGREFDPSVQCTPFLPLEEGSGIPSASRTPGCPPPRQEGGEGGFKGSGFILPPPPRGWPQAPSLLPSEQFREAGAGGATHSWSGAWGPWGGGPGLAAVQASGDCARCPGAPDGKRWGKPGCARRA